MTKAEVAIDPQHGPIVSVTMDGSTVSVYLMDRTAVLTTENGQYGIEVTGPWHQFEDMIRIHARLGGWNSPAQPGKEVTCTVCGEKKGSPLGGAKGTKK